MIWDFAMRMIVADYLSAGASSERIKAQTYHGSVKEYILIESDPRQAVEMAGIASAEAQYTEVSNRTGLICYNLSIFDEFFPHKSLDINPTELRVFLGRNLTQKRNQEGITECPIGRHLRAADSIGTLLHLCTELSVEVFCDYKEIARHEDFADPPPLPAKLTPLHVDHFFHQGA
jgi:hypothetical protein